MKEKHLRNEIIKSMMCINGLRTSEIEMLNEGDVVFGTNAAVRIVVGGFVVILKSPLSELLLEYMSRRAAIEDMRGKPLFVAVGNRAGGRRISKRGLTTLFTKGEIVL